MTTQEDLLRQILIELKKLNQTFSRPPIFDLENRSPVTLETPATTDPSAP